jgi:hypothetical protein
MLDNPEKTPHPCSDARTMTLLTAVDGAPQAGARTRKA